MGQAAASTYVNLEDYFEAEVASTPEAPKHEWFDGVVYAMSRGTPEHGRLTASATIVVGNALPADCRVYSSDTMLYVAPAKLATYADASVVCGPLETITVRKNGKALGQAVTNPIVIIEILSESTERYDRDGKFQAYKQLTSLQEYVLISQDERRIEVFRRVDDWVGDVGVAGGSVQIHGALIDVDRIYGPG
ncbi:MAG: Uma2 family endonuclease [Labilithrix sp.]|nr:Uma2 family endonuclease [Labilithrix sp.]